MKVAANLFEELRSALEAGEGEVVRDGRLLPERRLMEFFGVGRHAVRMALKSLEDDGLVFRRQGLGTFTAHTVPDITSASRLSNRTSPPEIMEVRRELEPALARLAAARASPRDVANLRRLTKRGAEATTASQYERWDRALHHAVAEIVRNALFLELFETIVAVRVQQSWIALREEMFSLSFRDELVGQHDRIVDAIADRDAAAAEAAMRAHLDHVSGIVQGQRMRPMADASLGSAPSSTSDG